MKLKVIGTEILLCIMLVSCLNAEPDSIPVLKGPYLGQTPPGNIPAIFAPGVVSKDGNQSKLFLTPDGMELIFSSMLIVPGKDNNPAERDISFISVKMEDNTWGEPVVLPFSRAFTNDEPALSYDGEKLFFVSNRPKGSHTEAEMMPDIWMVGKSGGEWSVPINVGAVVNTDDLEVQPFYSTDDKLYFNRRDGIYYSQFSDGRFSIPVKLDEKIFKGRLSGLCISPDNAVLMVHSNMEGGLGSFDLYVSFRHETGAWSNLVNVGDPINSGESEANATFSPDGKYIFFSRSGDIYWVSASSLEKLKEKVLLKEKD